MAKAKQQIVDSDPVETTPVSDLPPSVTQSQPTVATKDTEDFRKLVKRLANASGEGQIPIREKLLRSQNIPAIMGMLDAGNVSDALELLNPQSEKKAT